MAGSSVDFTFQNAAVATDTGIAKPTDGYSSVLFDVSITGTSATIDVTGKGPLGTARAIAVEAASNGAHATNITASGFYRATVLGLDWVILTLSAISSANVSVKARFSEATVASVTAN